MTANTHITPLSIAPSQTILTANVILFCGNVGYACCIYMLHHLFFFAAHILWERMWSICRYFRMYIISGHSIYLFMALQPFIEPWPLFQFLDLFYIVGRTPSTGDQPVARPLPAHGTTQAQNKRTQTSIPQVGFEPTIPAFQREKTVHALDRAATVTGNIRTTRSKTKPNYDQEMSLLHGFEKASNRASYKCHAEADCNYLTIISYACLEMRPFVAIHQTNTHLNLVPRWRMVEYFHAPICLHDLVLNQLRAGKPSPCLKWIGMLNIY
jgi:hypothetical protein